MIEFWLLGEVRLRGTDQGEVHALLRQPKRLALLAYLVTPLPGTWHRRETLLALFWPELDTVHARTSLRNALYVLRQILGDDVLRNREGVDGNKARADGRCSGQLPRRAVAGALRIGQRRISALARYRAGAGEGRGVKGGTESYHVSGTGRKPPRSTGRGAASN